MRIGIPRESKEGERRVGLDPNAVGALVRDGHEVRVATGAGAGIDATDEAYLAAGASIVDAAGAWRADLVVKVKEIQPAERERLAETSTIFSYSHLVGEPQAARALAAQSVTVIAYEMVRDDRGGFPLLAPMSVIAGRLAIQVGAQLLAPPAGGNGTLFAGGPGSEPACVLVLGGGHAGSSAALVAAAMGAKVTILTRSTATRDALAARLAEGIEVGLASPEAVERHALSADLVVGAVFIPGAPTPKLLPRSLVARMKAGAVIVDVSIDAGGVAQTSRPTSHANPTFVEEGVVHYCVANMPSAEPRAGAAALSCAALPYVRALAGKGIARAIREDRGLRAGVLIWRGRFTHEGIAFESGRPYSPLTDGDLD